MGLPDLTDVAWRRLVYVAVVVDAWARRTVGVRVPHPLPTDLALDALEQALYECLTRTAEGLVHLSDRGIQ